MGLRVPSTVEDAILAYSLESPTIAEALEVTIAELIPKTKRFRPVRPLKGFDTTKDAIEFAVLLLRSYQSIDEA